MVACLAIGIVLIIIGMALTVLGDPLGLTGRAALAVTLVGSALMVAGLIGVKLENLKETYLKTLKSETKK